MLKEAMRLLRIFVVLSMLFSLTTCSNLVGRRMQAHTHRPFDTNIIPLSLNGIYFKVDPKDGHYCRPPWAFFLYADGTVIANTFAKISKEVNEQEFWSDPEKYIRTMKRWEHLNAQEGHYFIEDGTITIELNYDMPSTPFRNFIRFQGAISSDSVLYLDSKMDTWCENETAKKTDFTFDRVYYKVYKTDVRPDSSKIWFKDASWYKKEVWYNQ